VMLVAPAGAGKTAALQDVHARTAGLPRIRHTGGSRYPDKHRTGCRIKSGMTKGSQFPAACGGIVYYVE
jgi:hypothetical protein